MVFLQPWASRHCLAVLLLIACCYSNTQQTFTSAWVCPRSMCVPSPVVHPCVLYMCESIPVWVAVINGCVHPSVCVAYLFRIVNKAFYYVLVGRLGIITQAWLSTYNVFRMRDSKKERLECVRKGENGETRSGMEQEITCCTMGNGYLARK